MNKAQCFICSTHLTQQWPDGLNTEPDYDPWEDVKDGISFRLNAGYGSKYDGDYGHIFICDTCYGARKEKVLDLKNWIIDNIDPNELIKDQLDTDELE